MISGYPFLIDGGAVSWSSEHQEIILLFYYGDQICYGHVWYEGGHFVAPPLSSLALSQTSLLCSLTTRPPLLHVTIRLSQYDAWTKHIDMCYYLICWVINLGFTAMFNLWSNMTMVWTILLFILYFLFSLFIFQASNRSFPSPLTVYSCAISIRHLYETMSLTFWLLVQETQRLAQDPYLANRFRDGLDCGEGDIFHHFNLERFADQVGLRGFKRLILASSIVTAPTCNAKELSLWRP